MLEHEHGAGAKGQQGLAMGVLASFPGFTRVLVLRPERTVKPGNEAMGVSG